MSQGFVREVAEVTDSVSRVQRSLRGVFLGPGAMDHYIRGIHDFQRVSQRVLLRVCGAIDHYIRYIKGFQRYFKGFISSLRRFQRSPGMFFWEFKGSQRDYEGSVRWVFSVFIVAVWAAGGTD